jgi:hypothetical protein
MGGRFTTAAVVLAGIDGGAAEDDEEGRELRTEAPTGR